MFQRRAQNLKGRKIGSATLVNTYKALSYLINELAKSGFLEIFLNSAIALQILLTVPMSVVTTEAFFSKLKIIKNYLKNTMTQTRSCSLAMILKKKKRIGEQF
ncbi:hypothetical protein ALC57_13181 [Trachymyrmex cornetzi]|uniref:HAT C-terminal dimerisation domain-containing protein n=1 Tax=Trachymyrmex cornetzi TaxID=471704 RepID=A0A151IZR3_9HYME|nr:hypothetical protein ALC57_13181 [Trachymyrmex cornetzi]